MPNSARVGDLWSGICDCHNPPEEMQGQILNGSENCISGNRPQARVTDITIGWCEHMGQIVGGSSTAFANKLPKARVGDPVVGCNIGTIVSGNPKHIICDAGGTAAPVALVKFRDTIILYTEVDFGNLDDEPDVDDGLNVYPPVKGGSAPTQAQVWKSAALESPSAKAPVVSEDPAPPPPKATPSTNCIDVPTPPPNEFQLSPNFALGDVSTKTALSRYQVVAQHGLTVPDIVCNLQAWAEKVGEALSSQYGRASLLITSGFRPGSSTSQHERGQACDVQFPGKPNSQLFTMAQWIRDNIAYDQFIWEFGGNKPWFHLSFNRAGNRPVSASNKFGTRTSAGSYVWGKLLEKA